MHAMQFLWRRWMMVQYSFYTLRTRGLVLLATTLVLTIPSLLLLLHSCTVTQVSLAPSFCKTPVVSSTKEADTTHLDEPLDLAEENLKWSGKLPLGGTFSPTACLPTTRVAILLPFRDREAHLATFIKKMHPFLQTQGIQYTLVVLNQTGSAPFMRGLLFNAGSSSPTSIVISITSSLGPKHFFKVWEKHLGIWRHHRIVLSCMTSTTYPRGRDSFTGSLSPMCQRIN